ncbi:MAG: sugar phosphate nucleotidyltransferase [Candidatus Thorarchaeota archaeon]
MKGVVLAGGSGSRLSPLTDVTNKHLLPVYDEPMIFKPLRTLIRSGITDIQIVVGGNGVGDVVKICGSGAQLGARLSYIHQDHPRGIADALQLTREFVGSNPVVVILGDNIFEDTFEREVSYFRSHPNQCQLFLKKVSHPHRFGVAELDDAGNLVGIEEKPINPKSNYIITGLYMYPPDVFEVIDWVREEIGFSKRGELEITDVNNYYVNGGRVKPWFVKGFWSDAGTFPTLLKAANFVAHQRGEYDLVGK